MGGEQSIPPKQSDRTQMFRLNPRSCMSFDCPEGETYFEPVEGAIGTHIQVFNTPFGVPASIQYPGLDKLNAVRRPNNWWQFIPWTLGFFGALFSQIFSSRGDLWYIGLLIVVVSVLAGNAVQQWQVNEFINRLHRTCDEVLLANSHAVIFLPFQWVPTVLWSSADLRRVSRWFVFVCSCRWSSSSSGRNNCQC
eukprot:gnl/MRDRNA2_/MRDRNA2_30881_c0_seq1.p1 gnl/MRDRNA2_/MRDRNA2_30881_c0~~gnl/MRDRNA2_/MRDRNA2_30881_c0_seq1.p1  ORF type:complete len:194 (+),score=15.39 gnl/MRDRNA2_/MRDRNA2_30881_c0_seq1:152-733(+)